MKQGKHYLPLPEECSKKRENIERKWEAGNDRRKRVVSCQNGSFGISDPMKYTLSSDQDCEMSQSREEGHHKRLEHFLKLLKNSVDRIQGLFI